MGQPGRHLIQTLTRMISTEGQRSNACWFACLCMYGNVPVCTRNYVGEFL